MDSQDPVAIAAVRAIRVRAFQSSRLLTPLGVDRRGNRFHVAALFQRLSHLGDVRMTDIHHLCDPPIRGLRFCLQELRNWAFSSPTNHRVLFVGNASPQEVERIEEQLKTALPLIRDWFSTTTLLVMQESARGE